MNIIGWIIIGGIAGWLGSLIVKDHGNGFLVNIIIGIIGAFVGGLIFNLFGGDGVTGFNLWSLLVALVGSVVLLWVIGLFSNGRSKDVA